MGEVLDVGLAPMLPSNTTQKGSAGTNSNIFMVLHLMSTQGFLTNKVVCAKSASVHLKKMVQKICRHCELIIVMKLERSEDFSVTTAT
jgi:hypothetical protein